jgi:magnesium transporter
MVNTYTYNGLAWIDVESPTRDEVAEIIKKYSISPNIGEEMLSPTSEPKVELHNECVYLTLDLPSRVKHGHKGVVVSKEIDFVVGKSFIITTRYDLIEPLHNFSKVFETNSILDKKGIGEHAGFVFYYMIKKLYAHIDRDLRNIRDDIKHAESRIYEGHEKRMVVVLSNIAREIIDAQQILRTHNSTLELLGLAAEKFFGPNFRYHTDDLTAEYKKVSDNVANLYELVRELRDTNASLLTSKQNETMKVFTMMAFVTFPLSLFISLFALDTSHKPIIGSPYDFEIFVGIIVFAIAIMLSFFKYKKWL